jgi:hypothetical protein
MSNQKRTEKYRTRSREKYLLAIAKHRAKRKQLEFSIDISDIIIPTLCPVFNVPFVLDGHSDWNSTIDRVDNSKGYIKGNVQVISRMANTMKANANQLQLKEFATWVLSNG